MILHFTLSEHKIQKHQDLHFPHLQCIPHYFRSVGYSMNVENRDLRKQYTEFRAPNPSSRLDRETLQQMQYVSQ